MTIGAVADALGRCSETVRRLERVGMLPPAPMRLPRRGGQMLRLYPVRYVEVLRELAAAVGLHQRRLRALEPELTAGACAARDAFRRSHC